MQPSDMKSLIVRGAAATLVTLASAGTVPLGAQSAGSIQTRQRDSTVFVRINAPSKAVIDSITTLMRALNLELPDSPQSLALRKQIDALLPGRTQIIVNAGRGGAVAALPRGWIGITPQGPKSEMISPDGDFIQYLTYPSIIAVDPESPAQRAGIAPGDLLIAYDGLDVRGHEFNLTQLLVPDRKLSVTVRRGDGETKDYAVTVVKAPERVFMRRFEPGAMAEHMAVERVRTNAGDDAPARMQMPIVAASRGMGGMRFPNRMFFSANGALGAIMTTVTPELAKSLKLETGVLVADVSDDTPASRSGLRAGDLIVGAVGQPVTSLKALQELIALRLADQSIALRVIREKKARAITVSW
ncbi:MAG: hypothetical protein JWM41_3467 [Gemmatimonadetes bacterium]|nr:hypothetical protein [Gemmatimonadota bacterium]